MNKTLQYAVYFALVIGAFALTIIWANDPTSSDHRPLYLGLAGGLVGLFVYGIYAAIRGMMVRARSKTVDTSVRVRPDEENVTGKEEDKRLSIMATFFPAGWDVIILVICILPGVLIGGLAFH